MRKKEKKTGKMFRKSQGGSGVIVAAVLLVIAIVLLVTFRDAITGWLQSLITFFGTQIANFTA